MNFLNGAKTYIVGVVSVIGAWIAVWGGTLDFAQAVQITETAVLGMTIRHGVATS